MDGVANRLGVAHHVDAEAAVPIEPKAEEFVELDVPEEGRQLVLECEWQLLLEREWRGGQGDLHVHSGGGAAEVEPVYPVTHETSSTINFSEHLEHLEHIYFGSLVETCVKVLLKMNCCSWSANSK